MLITWFRRMRWLGTLFVAVAADQSHAGSFKTIGVPVRTVSIMGTVVGLDEKGEEAIYFNCSQPGNRLFLLQVNARSGKTRQFGAPVGEGARSTLLGPDGGVYLGTWESGYLLKFDPRHPEKNLESLGKPSPKETYIWELITGADNRVYGCTYPHAHLIRLDSRTGKSEDLGALDANEMYARSVASSTNGFIYVGIGSVHAQVVRFNPATGNIKPLLPENRRPPGFALVSRAIDGNVYATTQTNAFRCDGDTLTVVTSVPPQPMQRLRDGRTVSAVRVTDGEIVYALADGKGKIIERTARFESQGIEIFAVGAGPGGVIYGSTVLPLEVFSFAPGTQKLQHLGPTPGAEVYSFTTDGKVLYSCAYPHGYLSVYDPGQPWHFGIVKGSNPRGLGPMGDGHLRPRAMVTGPDGRIYVGSLPPYGEVGGALGVYDPQADKVVENYRNLVPDQGISALCVEPKTQMLFGGSSAAAGGGGRAVAKECVVFAWDWKTKRKKWENAVVPGDSSVVALTAAHGKVFGVSSPSQTLFVLEAATFEVLHKEKVTLGRVHEISMGYFPPHDCIYGLANDSIFKVDPATFQITEIAKSEQKITCGFAITETGIYFGSRMNLMVWRWNDLHPVPAQGKR